MAATTDNAAIRDAVVRVIDSIGGERKKEGRMYIVHVNREDTVLNFHQYLGPEAIVVHASCNLEAYVVIADNVVNETRNDTHPIKYEDFFTANPTRENLCAMIGLLKYSLIEMGPGMVNHIYKIDNDGRTIKAARTRE